MAGRYDVTPYVDIEAIKARAIPVNGTFPGRLKFKWGGLYHYGPENLLVSHTRFLRIPYLTVIDLGTGRVVPKFSRKCLTWFYIAIMIFACVNLFDFGTPSVDPILPSSLSQSPPLGIRLFFIYLVFFIIQWQIQDEHSRAIGALRRYTTGHYWRNRLWESQQFLIIMWTIYLVIFYRKALAAMLHNLAVFITGLF